MGEDFKNLSNTTAIGIDQIVLREIWSSAELPRIQGIKLFGYFLRRGLETLKELPMSNLITVLTISGAFFIFSAFWLILANVDRMLSNTGNNLQLTAYFKTEASSEQIKEFLKRIKTDKDIQSLEFISKDEALKFLKRDLGPRSGFLEGLENENPLPASVDIVLDADEVGLGKTEAKVNALRSNPLIEEVVFGSELVEKFQGMLKIFRLFALVSVIVALATIIFLISNTIKLVIYSRKDEIAIMKLVGATDYFIILPFILGGLIQGLIGSLVSLFLLKGAYLIVNYKLSGAELFQMAFTGIKFFGPLALLVIIFLGVAVGGLGSLFALRRYLDV